MFFVILILLVLAAALGILGAVLKVAAILVLAIVLTITVVVALGWWALKRSTRSIAAEYDRQISESRAPRHRANEADPGELPNGRDDRY